MYDDVNEVDDEGIMIGVYGRNKAFARLGESESWIIGGGGGLDGGGWLGFLSSLSPFFTSLSLSPLISHLTRGRRGE